MLTVSTRINPTALSSHLSYLNRLWFFFCWMSWLLIIEMAYSLKLIIFFFLSHINFTMTFFIFIFILSTNSVWFLALFKKRFLDIIKGNSPKQRFFQHIFEILLVLLVFLAYLIHLLMYVIIILTFLSFLRSTYFKFLLLWILYFIWIVRKSLEFSRCHRLIP